MDPGQLGSLGIADTSGDHRVLELGFRRRSCWHDVWETKPNLGLNFFMLNLRLM
ncbi:hypothetical protein I79_010032 [Cricetulus griseus]|uniref:Uncharacterized protein n=1 Tax=Cricetulus griseus TaxID=10029 RepID=G3HHD3_CRIGR|nr:hypothetical protein I79_010032 [Cricetulus griseus]